MGKTWVRPELTVLTRGTVAESVLEICKGNGFGGTQKNHQNNKHDCINGGTTSNCGFCAYRSLS